LNERGQDQDPGLWVAMLSGASSPLTATYPVSWGALVSLVRELKGPGRTP
jgi:hypothetical protein